jgi:chromosome segregation ATPase
VSRLSEAEASASSTRSELLAARQEAAHLKGQLEAKDRTVAGLENELRTLRQQQNDAGAAQVKQQQELDVAKAEVARLQGQLGVAGRLQGQLEDLRAQLAAATQRETTLQQQKAAAERDAEQKAAQVC